MTNKDPNHPAATFSDRRQVGDRREQSVPIAHYDRRSYLRRSKYTQFISKPWWLLVNYLNERLTDGSNQDDVANKQAPTSGNQLANHKAAVDHLRNAIRMAG